jgi:hypothetical protein
VDDAELADWTERFTSISSERLLRAQERLATLAAPHVQLELSRPGLDAAVAATMLAEALEGLIDADVPEAKLVAKLRADKDVWPTWAELTAAAAIVKASEPGLRLRLEAGRAEGAHADFVLDWEGSTDVHIEFKALGLSDQEAAFSAAVAPALRSVLPKRGVAHLHAALEQTGFILSRAERRHIKRESEARAKNLPARMRDIAAAVAVAHGTEAMYLARLRERFEEALRQLPTEQPSWVGFTWANGAPMPSVAQALETIEIPSNVLGVMFFGTVVVLADANLHHFVIQRPAPFDRPANVELRSLHDVEYGQVVLDIAEAHTNVRPMVLAVPTRDGRHEFVTRDGSRRILPFSLLLAGDPDEYRR